MWPNICCLVTMSIRTASNFIYLFPRHHCYCFVIAGPYCGRNGPADTVTVGPVYYITLFADFAVVSSGFRVVFNALGTPVVVTTPGPTGPTTEPPTTTTTTPGPTTEPPTTTTTTPAPTTPAVIRTCSFEASI